MSITATRPEPALPFGRPLTVSDLRTLPDDDGHRYELLDGVLVVTPSPTRLHQRMVTRLAMLLSEACPADLDVVAGPFAVQPDRGRAIGLQPDLIVAADRDFTDRDLPTAPLLAVEVTSPNTRLFDLTVKYAAYERMGTPTYWLLDPTVPDLRVYERTEQGGYERVAHVAGAEEYLATRPFPVLVRPDHLVGRR
jgi:Uma2 family endonuclease